MENMFESEYLDIEFLLSNGFFKTKLKNKYVKILEDKTKEIDWKYFENDFEKEQKFWKSRYNSFNVDTKLIKHIFGQKIKEFANPILKYHYTDTKNIDIGVDFTMTQKDFEMSWHNDIISGSSFFVLFYLYSDPKRKVNSGKVELGKCKKDKYGTTIPNSYYDINSYIPEHGDVVFIENKNPLFEHQVLSFKEENLNRYMVRITIGSEYF